MTATRSRRARRAAVIAALASFVYGPLSRSAEAQVAVLEEPDGLVVAVAVAVPAGGGLEPEGEGGLAYLAGLAILEEMRPRLDRAGASAGLECGASVLTFTLLVPPDEWQTQTRMFLRQLVEASPGDDAIERARARIGGTIAMRAGNPAADVRHTLREVLFRSRERWAETACGQPETLAEAETDAVKRQARARFAPSRTSIAIAGPVERQAAQRLVDEVLGSRGRRVSAPSAPALRSGNTTVRRNTVTTWLSLAFPFPAEADPEALRFLAFRLREAASPSPARPDVYNIRVELESYGSRGVLAVHMVTSPETADRWRNSLVNLVGELGRAPLDPTTFEPLLRRYHGERLLEIAAPEARASEAARDGLASRRAERGADRIAKLEPEDVKRAASSLGAPAVVILGPE